MGPKSGSFSCFQRPRRKSSGSKLVNVWKLYRDVQLYISCYSISAGKPESCWLNLHVALGLSVWSSPCACVGVLPWIESMLNMPIKLIRDSESPLGVCEWLSASPCGASIHWRMIQGVSHHHERQKRCR